MTITVDQATTEGPAFTVPLAELTEALNALALAVPTRPAVPVLGGVLVTQDRHGARLSTFDYETSIRFELEGHPGGPESSVLVSLAELRKVVKAAKQGETARSVAGWTVELTSRSYGTEADAEVTVGGFTVPVNTLPAKEFPNLPVTADTTFAVDRDVLLEQLTRVAVAAGVDPTLPMLTGVRFELKHGELVLAATDRFRLAVNAMQVEGEGSGEWLVPAKELLALVKAMPAGPVYIGTGLYTWTVRGGAITATQRLLDSEFPRWRQLLRTEHQTVVEVDRAALVRSVSKAIAIGSALNTRYLALASVEGQLTVSPHVGDVSVQGRVRGQSLAASVEGPAMVVGYTGEYLLAALKSFEGDTVFFGIDTPTRPPLLADDRAGLRGFGHRHLLMPARLGVEA
jgi:DNA polymerase-3 subunit beta